MPETPKTARKCPACGHEKWRHPATEIRTYPRSKTGSCGLAGAGGTCGCAVTQEEIDEYDAIVSHHITVLRQLAPDKRLEILQAFCRYCGNIDPRCHCNNDV
jgi:transcription elongation factor Elf1